MSVSVDSETNIDLGISDPYAELPELYDLEHGDFVEDLDFYLNMVEVVGDPVLELGCGTGRLLLPLAKAGWRVTGVDRSEAMLARAAVALARQGSESRASLSCLNMTEADQAPGGPFGVVIIALNGLMHLPTADQQRKALLAAKNALDPRGQLIIDIINPTPATLLGFDHRVVLEGSWTLPSGEKVDKFGSRRLKAAAQRIETDIWYDRVDSAGVLKRIKSTFPLRYVYPSELALMLELAGFAEWQMYGSYELDPFDDESERLIVTADVTAS